MKQVLLPNAARTRRGKLPHSSPSRHRGAPHHLRLLPAGNTSLARVAGEETAWDTAAMLRRLSSRFPNLETRLLGWVLLAAKVRLPPGESPAAALEEAEHLIRCDLYDGTAAVRG